MASLRLFVKQLIECNDAAGCGRCNDLRIAVKIIEERLASRESRTLSAVPSELEKKLINKILRAQRYLELSENKKAWNELYLTPDERGIAG